MDSVNSLGSPGPGLSLGHDVAHEAERSVEQACGRRQRLNQYVGYLDAVGERTMRSLRETLTGSSISEDEQPSLQPDVRGNNVFLQVVNSRCFQTVNYLAVFVATLLVSLQIDLPQHMNVWYVLDLCCLVVFCMELVAKLCALRWAFFRDMWNIFDIVLVAINLVDLLEFLAAIINPTLLRILRGLRVVRGGRLWKVFPELQHISSLIGRSVRSVAWGLVLLLIVLYMGGILACIALRDTMGIYPGYSDVEREWEPLEEFNPLMYFGSVVDSMYTLFNLVLLTEFSEFARAIWMQQPILFVCFAAFACFLFLGMQSFLITACMERAADADRELHEGTKTLVESRKLHMLKELCDIFFRMDSEDRGVLTAQQLEAALEDEAVRNSLELLDLPVHLSSEELFLLLDDAGYGEITQADFARNAVRLVASSTRPFEWHCLTQLSMNRIAARLNRLEQRLPGAPPGGSASFPTPWSPPGTGGRRSRRLSASVASASWPVEQQEPPMSSCHGRSGGLFWTGPLDTEGLAQPQPSAGELQALLKPMFQQLHDEMAAYFAPRAAADKGAQTADSQAAVEATKGEQLDSKVASSNEPCECQAPAGASDGGDSPPCGEAPREEPGAEPVPAAASQAPAAPAHAGRSEASPRAPPPRLGAASPVRPASGAGDVRRRPARAQSSGGRACGSQSPRRGPRYTSPAGTSGPSWFSSPLVAPPRHQGAGEGGGLRRALATAAGTAAAPAAAGPAGGGLN